MPVTVTLSTVPGSKSLEDYGISRTMDLFGASLGHEVLPAVANVDGIKAAVARFGARTRAEHPEASFYVSISLATGQRKPNNFDAACRNNGLGQEDFMRITDRRTRAVAPAAPAGTRAGQPAA